VSTVCEIAQAANVKPNTFVRMARQIGYDGYEDFRALFGEAIRNGTVSFHDRARWLQGIRRSGEMGKFYAEMVHSILRNIEETFAGIDTDLLQKAAEAIWAARLLYQLRYQPMTQCRKHTSPHHKCKFGQNKSCRFNDMIYNTIAMVSMIAPMVPNGL